MDGSDVRAALCRVLLVLIAAFAVAVDAIPCTHDFIRGTDTLGSFDLSSLTQPGGSYTVSDMRDSNFSYVFNICDNVGTSPSRLCATENGLAPAYQLRAGAPQEQACYRLAASLHESSQITWKMLSDDDTSKGVSITYTGGELCNSGPRALVLNFFCADQEGFNLENNGGVQEFDCTYELNINSIVGCPLTCEVGSNRRLCSGNGVCGMDRITWSPRCFCFEGRTGADCSEHIENANSGLGATGISAVIGIIILSILLLASFVMLYKLRTLRRIKNSVLESRLTLQPDPDEEEVFSLNIQ